MSEEIAEGEGRVVATRWEYKVARVALGPIAFQKYGPDPPSFQTLLNDLGNEGWEAFHVQAFADGESLLLFLKRPAPGS
jgi:hypothetical protein